MKIEESNLLVLEPQWIKSTDRARRLLIPLYVCSLRGNCPYDELQTAVTEVGQVKEMVTSLSVRRLGFILRSLCLVFMLGEWQWDRSVCVLQLSVANISLPMHHSHLLICHQQQIISETDSDIKLHNSIKWINRFVSSACSYSLC
jgi:hypothetical protein